MGLDSGSVQAKLCPAKSYRGIGAADGESVGKIDFLIFFFFFKQKTKN